MGPRGPLDLGDTPAERPQKEDSAGARLKSAYKDITGGTLMKMLGRYFVFEYEHHEFGRCQVFGKILGGDILKGVVTLHVSSEEMTSYRGHIIKCLVHRGGGKWVMKYTTPTYSHPRQWPPPLPAVVEMPGVLELL